MGKKIYPTGKKKIFPTGENSYEKKFSPVRKNGGNRGNGGRGRNREEEGGKGPLSMLLGHDYGLKRLT